MIYSRLSTEGKLILTSWLIVAVLFFFFGVIVGVNLHKPKTTEPINIVDVSEAAVDVTEPIPEPIPEFIYTSLGEFKLTAYCSCEECCDRWATIRPVTQNGDTVVYTADQSIAVQGVTVAADTDVLPFGTVILIDGNEYIVQDRGGAVKENHIDIYFESHEEALQFGVQYQEIFIKEKNNDNK